VDRKTKRKKSSRCKLRGGEALEKKGPDTKKKREEVQKSEVARVLILGGGGGPQVGGFGGMRCTWQRGGQDSGNGSGGPNADLEKSESPHPKIVFPNKEKKVGLELATESEKKQLRLWTVH